jgi:hypothetical protein
MEKFMVTRTRTVTEQFVVDAPDCESASQMVNGSTPDVDIRVEQWARKYEPMDTGLGSIVVSEDAEFE